MRQQRNSGTYIFFQNSKVAETHVIVEPGSRSDRTSISWSSVVLSSDLKKYLLPPVHNITILQELGPSHGQSLECLYFHLQLSFLLND
jgi:hypothetical protein